MTQHPNTSHNIYDSTPFPEYIYKAEETTLPHCTFPFLFTKRYHTLLANQAQPSLSSHPPSPSPWSSDSLLQLCEVGNRTRPPRHPFRNSSRPLPVCLHTRTSTLLHQGPVVTVYLLVQVCGLDQLSTTSLLKSSPSYLRQHHHVCYTCSSNPKQSARKP
jgi:hypothetical protein